MNEKEKGMPYDFSWAVKDEPSQNDYAHEEKSDGEVVTGSYRVLLPDGRTQIVTYRVQGDSGFVAEVKYEGEIKTNGNGNGNGANGNGNYGSAGASGNGESINQSTETPVVY
jgi:hypothetical protein